MRLQRNAPKSSSLMAKLHFSTKNSSRIISRCLCVENLACLWDQANCSINMRRCLYTRACVCLFFCIGEWVNWGYSRAQCNDWWVIEDGCMAACWACGWQVEWRRPAASSLVGVHLLDLAVIAGWADRRADRLNIVYAYKYSLQAMLLGRVYGWVCVCVCC